MGKMGRCLGTSLELALDSWMLGAEASLVVSLRLARLARGGQAGKAEARLMVTEKVAGQAALMREIATGRLGTGPLQITGGAVRHYLVRVRANRKRLMGAS